MIRFGLVLVICLGLAVMPLRYWAAAAYPTYVGSLFLLIAVEFLGATGGGAQRWLDVGPVRIQPSEFMKVAILLALARFYHQVLDTRETETGDHFAALCIIICPVFLVIRQPDLGTSLMLIATGGVLVIFAGLHWRVIVFGALALAIVTPIAVNFGLKDYQRERVLTFLDPSREPLGAGYQLTQAKIAIGSGQLTGKGYMQGTQSQNEYIPEQHTDFIFTILAEEFGFVGSLSLLLAWAIVLGFGLRIANQSTSAFGALASVGAVATLAFYIVVNIGMVMGLLPVVGVPLPLLSYGGTAMVTVMVCCALLLAVHVERENALVLKGVL